MSIRDDETERIARQLATQRQSTMTAVIRSALKREVARNDIGEEDLEKRFDVAVRRAQQMVRDGVIDWITTKDELLGYDEFGIPGQR